MTVTADDLVSLRGVQRLLRSEGVKPSRERSQHFLVDASVRDALFAAADLTSTDDVLEIGAGFGTLTVALAKRCRRVVAVEVDHELVRLLQTHLSEHSNVRVVPDNVKKISLGDLVKRFEGRRISELAIGELGTPSRANRQFANSPIRYKLVSSLPYHLTGFLLEKFLSEPPKPSVISVLVQKEVAERVVAKPGAMSTVSVSVQYFGRPELIRVVPAASFWPPPAVDSAVLRIIVSRETVPAEEERAFFRAVRAGFSRRRQQLHNSLSGALRMPSEAVRSALISASIDPATRAQNLSVDDWKRLAYTLSNALKTN